MKKRTRFTPNEIFLSGDSALIALYDKLGNIKAYAIIDLEDVERCRQHKWHEDDGYVATNIYKNGVRRLLRLHNFSKPRS